MKYIKLRQLNKRLYFETDDLADALWIKRILLKLPVTAIPLQEEESQ